MKNHAFRPLKKSILNQAFDAPNLLTQKSWRMSGSVFGVPVSLAYFERGYEFIDKDQKRLFFVLESVEEDVENGQSGLELSWRLWDTQVAYSSFIAESEKENQRGAIDDFCKLLLGGEAFGEIIQLLLQQVSVDEIYQTCLGQKRDSSFEILYQILI